jgi:hypothetical protein
MIRVRLRCAEARDHLAQQAVDASAQIAGSHRQPDLLDPDHPSHARSHCAHSAAADTGHATSTRRPCTSQTMRAPATAAHATPNHADPDS